MRLDKQILETHPDFSRSRIEGLIKAGFVTVNGAVAEKAGMKISDEDEIVVEIPPPVPAVPEPEDIPLSVVYEDDDLVVIDKPPGLVVHPAPGHYTGTLVNALLHHCPKLSGIGGVARPGIVHRLDQDTSGLIVVAKSQPAMDGLVRAFASHRNIEKTYLAACHGRPRLDAGRIENLIGRHPVDRKRMAIVERNGKLAITNWRLLPPQDLQTFLVRADDLGGSRTIGRTADDLGGSWTIGRTADDLGGSWTIGRTADDLGGSRLSRPRTIAEEIHRSADATSASLPRVSADATSASLPRSEMSLIECRIETGRTHQIRVHMASLGCPVVGDRVYGKPALDRRLDPPPTRQLLHAWRLKLWHPVENRLMEFEAPVPPDFALVHADGILFR